MAQIRDWYPNPRNPLGRFGPCAGSCCCAEEIFTTDLTPNTLENAGAYFSDDFSTAKSGWGSAGDGTWSVSSGMLVHSPDAIFEYGGSYYHPFCWPFAKNLTIALSADVLAPTGAASAFAQPVYTELSLRGGCSVEFRKFYTYGGGGSWSFLQYSILVSNTYPGGTLVNQTWAGTHHENLQIVGDVRDNENGKYRLRFYGGGNLLRTFDNLGMFWPHRYFQPFFGFRCVTDGTSYDLAPTFSYDNVEWQSSL